MSTDLYGHLNVALVKTNSRAMLCRIASYRFSRQCCRDQRHRRPRQYGIGIYRRIVQLNNNNNNIIIIIIYIIIFILVNFSASVSNYYIYVVYFRPDGWPSAVLPFPLPLPQCRTIMQSKFTTCIYLYINTDFIQASKHQSFTKRFTQAINRRKKSGNGRHHSIAGRWAGCCRTGQ